VAVADRDSIADSAERNAQSFGTLIALLSPERDPPPVDSVLNATERLWFWQLFSRRMPAYAEFLDDIGLSGVTDPELRSALYRYESALEEYLGWEDYMRTAQVNLWKPAFLGLLPSPFPGGEAGQFDVRQLAGDQAFLNVVAERRSVEGGLSLRRRDLSAAASEVVDLLDAAVAR
jgi:hypothetical protein